MTACESASALEIIGREHDFYFSAAELMARRFPEPRWAVPGLIAEGLTLLVGAPKLGKSWLCLNLAVSIAAGGTALGSLPVDRGSVLYAALEDTPRRLHARLGRVLGNSAAPDGLHFTTSLPRLPHAAKQLDGWLDAQSGSARLVVVDVLRKVRPVGDGRSDVYAADYEAAGLLKRIADVHGVAVLAVHHTRKSRDEDDVFNEVSGSTGLTGAADATILAKRVRGTNEAVLHVTGRDVPEAEHAMAFDQSSCSWALTGELPALVGISAERRRLLEYVTVNEGASPAEISNALGLNPDNVRQMLRRMVRDDQLDADTVGRYFLPARVTGVTQSQLRLEPPMV